MCRISRVEEMNMEDYRVECSVKFPDRPHAHERIQGIGGFHAGSRWKHTRDEAIKNIDNRKYHYYVQLPNGSKVDVIATDVAPRYLTTKGDGEKQNNLLSLPECPG